MSFACERRSSAATCGQGGWVTTALAAARCGRSGDGSARWNETTGSSSSGACGASPSSRGLPSTTSACAASARPSSYVRIALPSIRRPRGSAARSTTEGRRSAPACGAVMGAPIGTILAVGTSLASVVVRAERRDGPRLPATDQAPPVLSAVATPSTLLTPPPAAAEDAVAAPSHGSVAETAIATIVLAGCAGLQGLLFLRAFGISARTDGFFAAYGLYVIVSLFGQTLRTSAVPLLAGTAARMTVGQFAWAV